MAADLVAAGVDVARDLPPRLRGLAGVQAAARRARARARRALRRRRAGAGAAERARTSSETGAEDGYTEGIVDRLRAVQGTKVAALARELQRRQRALEGLAALERRRRRRLDDRPRGGRRRPQGGCRLHDRDGARPTLGVVPAGAGHAPSSRAGRGRSVRRRLRPRRQAGGQDLARHHGARAPRARACARRATPGTLDPFATGLMVILVGRARRVQRFVAALPKEYVADRAVRRRLDDRRPRRRDHARRASLPQAPLELPLGTIRQRPPAYSAVHVDGRAGVRSARARGEDVRDSRARGDDPRVRAAVAGGRPRRAADRLLVGDVRAQPRRRPRRRLHRGAAAHADRAVRASTTPIPGGSSRSTSALDWFAPARLEGDAARRAAHGVAVAAAGGDPRRPTSAGRRRRRARSCSSTTPAPIALARRLPDGGAQAFRRLPRVKVTRLSRGGAAPAARRRRRRSTASTSGTAR